MHGMDRVAEVFQHELGIKMGGMTADGKIGLEWTSDIGMADQAPAALINDVVVTHLSTDKACQIVADLKKHMDPRRLAVELGDGNNAHDLVQSMVENNIRTGGPVVLASMTPGEALSKALGMTPAEVIRDVKNARLRGRGGAGFPTGMKWEFTRAERVGQALHRLQRRRRRAGHLQGPRDPDRVRRHRVRGHDDRRLRDRRCGRSRSTCAANTPTCAPSWRTFSRNAGGRGLLGKNVCGKDGFNFDIRIQMGAGAYVCGEETVADQLVRGAARRSQDPPAVPRAEGLSGLSDRRQQRRNLLLRRAHPGTRRRPGSPVSEPIAAQAPRF